jgi:hypothetical protein
MEEDRDAAWAGGANVAQCVKVKQFCPTNKWRIEPPLSRSRLTSAPSGTILLHDGKNNFFIDKGSA